MIVRVCKKPQQWVRKGQRHRICLVPDDDVDDDNNNSVRATWRIANGNLCVPVVPDRWIRRAVNKPE